MSPDPAERSMKSEEGELVDTRRIWGQVEMGHTRKALKRDALCLTTEHGARLEDKIFGAPSFKPQAPSLTSFKL